MFENRIKKEKDLFNSDMKTLEIKNKKQDTGALEEAA